MKKFFTSESVTEGHPDKLCDLISDSILDACLQQDEFSRVACETVVGKNLVLVTGELTTNATIDIERIVRDVLKGVGYNSENTDIDYRTCKVIVNVSQQSADIALGVDIDGAGDQGIMFGYATKEAPEYMPAAIYYAHKLAERLSYVRKQNILPYLRPDGKTQVTIEYDGDTVKRVDAIVVSSQHLDTVDIRTVREDILRNVIKEIIPKCLVDENTKYYINPTGRFVVGGPLGDAGLCLDENTLVSTTKGLVKIKDIKIGTELHTENGIAHIIDKFENGIKTTNIITDENNHTIEATLNHPFRVWNGEKIIWKHCGDLQVGDVLLRKKYTTNILKTRPQHLRYQKQNQEFDITLNQDMCYILGWLIGDGNCTADDRITFYFGDDSEKEHVKNMLRKCFPEEQIMYYDYLPDRYQILSKDLVKQLRLLGVSKTTAREKEIPQCILSTVEKNKGAFIAGLFDADGFVKNNTGRNKEYITILLKTSSYKLAQQMAQILHTLGIHSTIDTSKPPKTHSKKDGTIVEANGDCYSVRITGLKSILNFKKKCCFKIKRKHDELVLPNLPDKYHYNDSNCYYVASLLRKVLRLNCKKLDKYFSRYDSVRSEKLNRAYSNEKIDYIIDMYAEYHDDENYKLLKYLYENFEMVKVKKIQASKANTYDISLDDDTHSFIANGFIVHNTGRKIIVDTYGGYAKHGGGAFSGKDPTKVDRSAAYMARYIAKNIVANGYADKCEIQLSYAIGIAKPMSIHVNTFGTNKIPVEEIINKIENNFDLTPAGIIKTLNLRKPIFTKTTNYGHFGKAELPWEKIIKI